MEDIYPSGPQNVPAELTKPTAAYKQRAWMAVGSLALFIVLYLALAGWFVWTAYRMLSGAVAGGEDRELHFLIGAGAAFLALFMLKALFFVKRGGAPDAVEVTEAEQPRLFAFLYRLADEAGAPRPKKVYLSARVNAAVFYDLSILNLLFPSRKNLEIGLALVNVLTLSEMKAVLAHELGHFAQRSMAIGSWVYIAQQIAEQIVAKRDALDKFLRGLSRWDIRVAWIGWLLSLIVWSIRSLMDTLLSLVVLAQRALSRQMEFQADLVAVSLTGSDELVHALHKLQAADDAWDRVFSFANAELRKGRIPHDLFSVQTSIIGKTATILDDESYGAIRRADAENPAAQRIFKAAFAQPPQMWSTHPASADRENNAKRIYLAAPHDERSAWLLFDEVDVLKSKVTTHLIGEVKAELASAEQTFEALDERYSLLQYQPRYRGAYLGRSLTRHATQPSELYEQALLSTDVQEALASLYPAQLTNDLTRLRELEEERSTLQAVRDKIYQATGGRIVHRGREIARRELPAAIREVAQEADEARQRILAHDRRNRGAHLAAAAQLGAGWREYLLGLIGVLHYAEHAAADLNDAHGLLANVFAVVTADGKVSGRELKRLISTANMLHDVLSAMHAQKTGLHLDQTLCARLEAASWQEMLGEFDLPPAEKNNIEEWIGVIDSWVSGASKALSALVTAALEQLLQTEDEVASHARERRQPEAAPAPSRVPPQYPTLLPGQERKRQQRLGLWDRFQTADGLAPAMTRVLVAGAIVGTVLGFGSLAGTTSKLSVYNGLGRAVDVQVGGKQLRIAPFSAEHMNFVLSEAITVEAKTEDGATIESFSEPLSGHSMHYVYNVAGASPMVLWTAAYGSAREEPPHMFGAPRWFTAHADVFFGAPPDSVKTKGGGETRTVLSGLGHAAPDDVLKLISSEAERVQLVQAHAQWDKEKTPFASKWRALASAEK